jgi:hypothetical protein
MRKKKIDSWITLQRRNPRCLLRVRNCCGQFQGKIPSWNNCETVRNVTQDGRLPDVIELGSPGCMLGALSLICGWVIWEFAGKFSLLEKHQFVPDFKLLYLLNCNTPNVLFMFYGEFIFYRMRVMLQTHLVQASSRIPQVFSSSPDCTKEQVFLRFCQCIYVIITSSAIIVTAIG